MAQASAAQQHTLGNIVAGNNVAQCMLGTKQFLAHRSLDAYNHFSKSIDTIPFVRYSIYGWSVDRKIIVTQYLA